MKTKIELIAEYYEELKGLKQSYKELYNCREFTTFTIMGENGVEMQNSFMIGWKAKHNLNEKILSKSIRNCMCNLQDMIIKRKNQIIEELINIINDVLTDADLEDNFWKEFKIKDLN